MKKIRLFLHKYRYFYSLVIVILMIVAVLFFKDKELLKADIIKGYVINIEKMVTPKVDVNYNEITKGINNGLEQQLKELNKLLDLNNNTNFTYINSIELDTMSFYVKNGVIYGA